MMRKSWKKYEPDLLKLGHKIDLRLSASVLSLLQALHNCMRYLNLAS